RALWRRSSVCAAKSLPLSAFPFRSSGLPTNCETASSQLSKRRRRVSARASACPPAPDEAAKPKAERCTHAIPGLILSVLIQCSQYRDILVGHRDRWQPVQNHCDLKTAQGGDLLTVIISGAGIAGLALALSCHQANIPFLIFEKAPELQP